LQNHWDTALTQFKFDGAWLSAGEADFHFQDDHGPKFKPNPYLSQWVRPETLGPGTRLLLRPGSKPILMCHQPTDYWHAATPLPDELNPYVDVRSFATEEALLTACQQEVGPSQRLAHIGPETSTNEAFGESNPVNLVNYLHYHRARKSAYELQAMRLATDIGVRGHLAAADTFAAGGTEFEIHMAFLQASQQAELDLPYGNIVALNEHGSILHYQHQDRAHPQESRSLLIDAGGNYRGYASDITRTQAGSGSNHGVFADLLERMETHQKKLVDSVQPGVTFGDLHVQMHQQLGEVLAASGIITCSAEAAFTNGITETFCPHGLGHLLGLQVHDVGGHLADEQGNVTPPPANYPTLRFTRAVDIDHVFTIEPGLYFINSLLDESRAAKADIDWRVVDGLMGYGGIRIEDNVRVLPDGCENMTRDAFRTHASGDGKP
jgi:Xaa-Pro dipeptidase